MMNEKQSQAAQPDAEPLPCPFCGNMPLIQDVDVWMIQCIYMPCPVGPSVIAASKEQAIAAWNTRRGPGCDRLIA